MCTEYIPLNKENLTLEIIKNTSVVDSQFNLLILIYYIQKTYFNRLGIKTRLFFIYLLL